MTLALFMSTQSVMTVGNLEVEASYRDENNSILSNALTIDDIFQDEEYQRYKHLPSGMKFDPKENKLFTWVTSNLHDYRVPYYIVKKGTLKLAKKAELVS